MRDRDLLVQETLAFVHSIAAAKPVRIETPTHVELREKVELTQLAKPKDRPATPIDRFFERDEIRRRVADFKATQDKFKQEREEYYKATITKVRSNSSQA